MEQFLIKIINKKKIFIGNIIKKKKFNKNKIYKISIILIFLLFYLININYTINNKIFQKKKSFKHKNKSFHGRIFDSFMYNNEAEIAYIRIWRLYDFVDKFIILASSRTFSGLPKNVSFSPYEKNLKPYMDKVDVVYIGNICNKKEYPYDNSLWCLEKSQRDYAKTYIEEHYNPTEDDLLIVTDLDEIITKEGIKYVMENPPKDYYYIKGSMYFPYYYHKVDNWNKGFIIRYNKNMAALSKYRIDPKNENKILKYKLNSTKPLITHCSYCFNNIEEYKNKFRSFAHKEFNKPPYITNNWIFWSVYCRIKVGSPPGYDEPYEGWKHLIPDDPRLKHLVDPSFMLPINETTYTEKDLKTLCDKEYRRTPFE